MDEQAVTRVRAIVRAVLASLDALGLVVVPKAPTKEMVDAAVADYYEWDRKYAVTWPDTAVTMYLAMIGVDRNTAIPWMDKAYQREIDGLKRDAMAESIAKNRRGD